VNTLTKAREVLDIEIAALQGLRDRLDANFNRAIALLRQCVRARHKIIVTGVGKSGNIGQKISATFASTGAPSILLHPTDALHGDLGVIHDGDVILMISYSGESDELINILPALRRFNVKIIAITGNPKSTVAKYADVHLDARVDKEACPMNLAPTASTTAALALGDALAMVLLESQGFKRDDFAKLHPHGAIGRALLLKAKDIMRTGKRFPVVRETEPVHQALKKMTTARAGSVCVVNATGEISGVFTQGDFVRRFQSDKHIGSKKIGEVMTPHPVTIHADRLAAEALRIFQQHRIDDLIVVNDKQRPVGIIDSQDLPKLKLT
jgi:arabinose-5-phosphate isomerase